MDYQVTGVDRDGQPFTRTVSADTIQAAGDAVRAPGVQVSEVREIPAAPPAASPPAVGPRLRAAELVFFSNHLAAAARLGLPLPAALRALALESARPAFCCKVESLAARVEQGQTLSEALTAEPAGFPAWYAHAVRAGERSGTLAPVLRLAGDHLHLLHALRRKTRELLVYPLVLVVALVLILSGYAVVGQGLAESIAMLDGKLPLTTTILLRLGVLAFPVLLGGVALVLMLLPLARWLMGRRWDRMLLRLPVVGLLVRSAIAARFCHLLPLLLDAGLPMPEALRLSAPALGNRLAEEAVVELADSVSAGGSLSTASRGSTILPATLIWMLGAGESRGELPATLREAAGLFETGLHHRLTVLETVFGPVVVVFVGVIVLSAATAVMLAPLMRLL